jgi:hypothetical protein
MLLFLDHLFGILKFILKKFNQNFKIFMTWVIFWYKIWNEKVSLNESYVVLKLDGLKKIGI